MFIYLFIWGFMSLSTLYRSYHDGYVVGRAEETSTYSSSRFCTVNCRPTASNYHLSHLRPCREPNPGLRGGRRECYHPRLDVEWDVNLYNLDLFITETIPSSIMFTESVESKTKPKYSFLIKSFLEKNPWLPIQQPLFLSPIF